MDMGRSMSCMRISIFGFPLSTPLPLILSILSEKRMIKSCPDGRLFSVGNTVPYQYKKEQEVAMKIRKIFKRAAAFTMAAVTALSVVPSSTALAAGDIGTISFANVYDGAGNAMRYNSSARVVSESH